VNNAATIAGPTAHSLQFLLTSDCARWYHYGS
jgi:hypothetical protein